jgi:hypothetical protein
MVRGFGITLFMTNSDMTRDKYPIAIPYVFIGNCDIQSGMNYLVYFELNQYK